MSPAAMSLVGFLLGVLVGAVAHYLFDRYQQARRERLLGALGGKIPEYERVARELEAVALSQAKQGFPGSSDRFLRQARQVRENGKQG
jgi:hypothetical protein